MIKTLEEIGMIDRRNLYHISCEKTEKIHEKCILVLKNSEQICLTTEDFKWVLKQILENKGYHTEEVICLTKIWNRETVCKIEHKIQTCFIR